MTTIRTQTWCSSQREVQASGDKQDAHRWACKNVEPSLKPPIFLPTIILALLLSACLLGLAGGCGCTCKTIQIDAAASDTLEASNERIAWVLPSNCQWEVRLDETPGGFLAVNNGPEPSIINSFYVQIHWRTKSAGAYQNNRHDYFDDADKETPLQRLGGGVETERTIGHICSSIGGWFGLKESTIMGRTYGAGTYLPPPPPPGYDWLYFTATQEAPEKYMKIGVQSTYSSPAQRDSIRHVVERFVASVHWLTPSGSNTTLDP